MLVTRLHDRTRERRSAWEQGGFWPAPCPSLRPWFRRRRLRRAGFETRVFKDPPSQTYRDEDRPAESDALCEGRPGINGFYGPGTVDANTPCGGGLDRRHQAPPIKGIPAVNRHPRRIPPLDRRSTARRRRTPPPAFRPPGAPTSLGPGPQLPTR